VLEGLPSPVSLAPWKYIKTNGTAVKSSSYVDRANESTAGPAVDGLHGMDYSNRAVYACRVVGSTPCILSLRLLLDRCLQQLLSYLYC
jgi:hypothetical protein